MNTRECARRLGAVALLVGLASMIGGCASPRVVTAVTSSRDQIKFLYVEGNDQGVIKCNVAGDGALSSCRRMAVSLED
jgi:hypothetical protein